MTSLQLPDDLVKQDLYAYSEATLNRGLCVNDAISGIGLLTNGFVWPYPQVWFDPSLINPITTGWTLSFGSSIVTTWTNEPSAGIWSEYPHP